mmetsp:Transcript_32081/g.90969  ORF Transcript_32081/g.90969 Transcript_32081/m.90969 type:complete len:404 (+) Transcript_32081:216-1427(+)|eukprot:CAMPEP_0117666586 /NCGR_PEP_ID=MMETSP0804-20121206/10459_1 /TAXON_ID=1074897 /ORGANISM="Tetraselmis astigmatica, Strain CCMP880" /LENGTH=403 /DNA_ID=CAMNT_0005474149 /DNA_START=144 /DNA_END=1355 /DNA_ORIENTATION=+
MASSISQHAPAPTLPVARAQQSDGPHERNLQWVQAIQDNLTYLSDHGPKDATRTEDFKNAQTAVAQAMDSDFSKSSLDKLDHYWNETRNSEAVAAALHQRGMSQPTPSSGVLGSLANKTYQLYRGIGEQLGGAAATAKDASNSAAEEARDKADNAAQEAGDKASEAQKELSDGVDNAKNTVADKKAAAEAAITDFVRDTRQHVGSIINSASNNVDSAAKQIRPEDQKPGENGDENASKSVSQRLSEWSSATGRAASNGGVAAMNAIPGVHIGEDQQKEQQDSGSSDQTIGQKIDSANAAVGDSVREAKKSVDSKVEAAKDAVQHSKHESQIWTADGLKHASEKMNSVADTVKPEPQPKEPEAPKTTAVWVSEKAGTATSAVTSAVGSILPSSGNADDGKSQGQ